jgi:hypothetical protein
LVWPSCDGFFEPKEKAKYLEEDTLGLEALQPIEIPQNGQSFLWKSLDENTLNLEKLARKLGRRLYSATPCLRQRPGAAG